MTFIVSDPVIAVIGRGRGAVVSRLSIVSNRA